MKRLTQAELARRAGVSRPNLSALERGRRECTLSTLNFLAFALGVTPGTLLDREPPVKRIRDLDRHQIDQVARSLLVANGKVPEDLLALQQQAAQEIGPLLNAAGIRNRMRTRKRIPRMSKDAVRRVLHRFSKLLASSL